MHTINLITKKLRLNIFKNEFNDFSEGLEEKLNFLADYILVDQRKGKLKINLKFVSTSEMIKFNKDFRNKKIHQILKRERELNAYESFVEVLSISYNSKS